LLEGPVTAPSPPPAPAASRQNYSTSSTARKSCGLTPPAASAPACCAALRFRPPPRFLLPAGCVAGACPSSPSCSMRSSRAPPAMPATACSAWHEAAASWPLGPDPYGTLHFPAWPPPSPLCPPPPNLLQPLGLDLGKALAGGHKRVQRQLALQGPAQEAAASTHWPKSRAAVHWLVGEQTTLPHAATVAELLPAICHPPVAGRRPAPPAPAAAPRTAAPTQTWRRRTGAAARRRGGQR